MRVLLDVAMGLGNLVEHLVAGKVCVGTGERIQSGSHIEIARLKARLHTSTGYIFKPGVQDYGLNTSVRSEL